jgi:hypothetical protein
MTEAKKLDNKKIREAEKIRARRELRVTYDIPASLRQRIKELAEEQRVPASQLVTLALLRFLKAYDRGEVHLGRYKQPSQSPRYDWNLIFPVDLLSILKKKLRREKPDETH